METIPSSQLGYLGGVFLANHLASSDNLARRTKRQNTYQRKLTIHKSGPSKQQQSKTILRERHTEPGLVAFYVIQPENTTLEPAVGTTYSFSGIFFNGYQQLTVIPDRDPGSLNKLFADCCGEK